VGGERNSGGEQFASLALGEIDAPVLSSAACFLVISAVSAANVALLCTE